MIIGEEEREMVGCPLDEYVIIVSLFSLYFCGTAPSGKSELA